jgi:hypothetical protein
VIVLCDPILRPWAVAAGPSDAIAGDRVVATVRGA